jgi:hypothetical protein
MKKKFQEVDYTRKWLEYIETNEYVNDQKAKERYALAEQSFEPPILYILSVMPNYHFNIYDKIIINLLPDETITIYGGRRPLYATVVTTEREFEQAIEYNVNIERKDQSIENKNIQFIDELHRILNLYRPMPLIPVIEHVNYQERWYNYVRSGVYFDPKEGIKKAIMKFVDSNQPNCVFLKQNFGSLFNYMFTIFDGNNIALRLLPTEYSDYPICEYMLNIQVVYNGENLADLPRNNLGFDNVLIFGFITPEKNFRTEIRNLCIGPTNEPFCILPLVRIDRFVLVIKKYRPLPKKQEYVSKISNVLGNKISDQKDVSTLIAEYNNSLK